MRWLLAIPVFILFMSNVPFIKQMKMAGMPARSIAKAASSGCSKSSVQNTSCKKTGTKLSLNQTNKKKSCTPSQSSCVCVTCFQFAAPAPVWQQYKFIIPQTVINFTGFLASQWKSLSVSPPWLPPDIVSHISSNHTI
jgi:hypothetical protein